MSRRGPLRKLVPLLVMLTLALGACGGGRGRVATPARSGAGAAAGSSPQPSGMPSLSPSAAASALPSTPPPARRPPAPRPPAPHRPPPPAAPAVPAAPVAGTGPAAPGEYLFDQSGVIRTAGCLVNNQPAPPTARVSVAAPAGNRQQINRDLSGPGGGSVTNTVFEYRDDGAYLVSLFQSQTAAAQTVSLDFEANPPVLAIPAFPRAGMTGGFTLNSRDGKVQLATTFIVEALNEPVTLGEGAVLAAHRIRTTSRLSGVSPQGSLNVTINRTSWYSPDKRLEIKDSTQTAGTVGLCRVDFQVDSVARSV